MSRATLEQDKKKTRAKDGPGAETDRKEREEYGEETDELEDDVPQGGRMSLLAHLNELRRRLTVRTIHINYVGPVIGNHSGPGTMALFFLGTQR